jgi:hypothetical protein
MELLVLYQPFEKLFLYFSEPWKKMVHLMEYKWEDIFTNIYNDKIQKSNELK